MCKCINLKNFDLHEISFLFKIYFKENSDEITKYFRLFILKVQSSSLKEFSLKYILERNLIF